MAFFFCSPIDFMLRMNLRKQYNMKMELLKSLFAAAVALAASSLQAKTRPFKKRDKLKWILNIRLIDDFSLAFEGCVPVISRNSRHNGSVAVRLSLRCGNQLRLGLFNERRGIACAIRSLTFHFSCGMRFSVQFQSRIRKPWLCAVSLGCHF